MSAGVAVDEQAVPRFGRGMKLRFDGVRNVWTVLGPERAFIADEHGAEVLRLIDGVRSVGDIVTDLAARFAAPREVIAADVHALLQDLSARGAIRLGTTSVGEG